MLKKSKKNIIKKLTLIMFIILGLTVGTVSVAARVTDPTHDTVVDPGYDPGLIGNDITDITGNAWATISVVVMAFAVGCIVITGLRYMMASSDRKADLKQSSAYIIIGCALIFATMPIISLATNTFKETVGEDNKAIITSNVANKAFDGHSTLKVVEFQEGVTSIGAYAFRNCTSLEGIILPSTIKTIAESAFEGCTNVKGIAIRGRDESVAVAAQEGNVKYYVEGVSIGKNAFKGCVKAEKFGFGQNIYVASIGEGAFSNCASLQGFYEFQNENITTTQAPIIFSGKAGNSINGYTVTSTLGKNAFLGTAVNSLSVNTINTQGSYTDPNLGTTVSNIRKKTNLEIESYIFTNEDDNNQMFSEIIVKDGSSVNFGANSFKNCINLANLDIGNNVSVNFGDYSFSDCYGLKTMTIGENCGSITFGDYSFNTAGSKLKLQIPDSSSSAEIKFGTSAFELANVSSLEIGKNYVVNIGENAFKDSMLESVTIGQGNNISIGKSSFEACDVLEKFNIPFVGSFVGESYSPYGYSQVLAIGDNAFADCVALNMFGNSENIVYLDLNKIGDSAFRGCSSLATFCMYAPNSTIDIGAYAFEGCTSFTGLNLSYRASAKIGNIGDRAFYDSGFSSNIVLYGNTIGLDAFNGTDVKSVTLYSSNDGYYIGERAFKESGITSIATNDATLQIAAQAFYDCDDLTTLTISFSTIGERAFYGCTCLTNVTLTGKGEAPQIIQYAFEESFSSEKDTYLNLTGSDINIQNHAFSTANVREVSLNGANITIGDHAFVSCDRLSTVKLAYLTTINNIGNNAFANCLNLISFVGQGTSGGTSIGSIGNYAFYVNKNLNGANLQEFSFTGGIKCKEIKSNAFAGRRVETLNILPFEVDGCTINEKAFYDIYNVYPTDCKIVMGNGRYIIKTKAFENADLDYIQVSNNTVFDSIPSEAFLNCGIIAFVNSSGDDTYIKCNNVETGAFKGAKYLKELYLSAVSSDSYLQIGEVSQDINDTDVVQSNATIFGSFDNYIPTYATDKTNGVSLTNVKFKGNVRIGVGAFAYIDSLETIGFETYNKKISCIEIFAQGFYACKNLSKIGLEDSNKLYFKKIGTNSFRSRLGSNDVMGLKRFL